MRFSWRVLLSILFLVPVLACTTLGDLFNPPTLNEDQCRAGQWANIGYGDAAEGFTQARLQKHAEYCARFQIVPNQQMYAQGWTQGLNAYCTPQKGYIEGIHGYSYHGICPPHLEARFLEQYNAGKHIHSVRSEYANMENEIDRSNDEIAELTGKLVEEKDDWRRRSIQDDISDELKKQARLQRKIQVYQMKHAEILAD